jgi:hypothetical protein
MGAHRFEELIHAQEELLDVFEQVQRDRLARVMQEPRLAADFATKLTRVRSMPEAVTVCQDWAARRMQMLGEDYSQLFNEGQAVANASLRFMSNGVRDFRN